MTTPNDEPKQIDSMDLPPVQYLVLENLAARYRTGEAYWTFHTKVGAAIAALEERGLVQAKSGVTERTIMAWLTDAGKAACLAESYVPPLQREINALAAEAADILREVKARPFCPHHDKGDPLCLAAAVKTQFDRSVF